MQHYNKEPENFLALPEIQPWLLQMADKVEQEACQIFFISHHPELINYLAELTFIEVDIVGW